MAGLTLVMAEAQLALWLEASVKVAAKQSYSINGRSLTLADAGEIRKQIDWWDQKAKQLARRATGRGGLRYGVPN